MPTLTSESYFDTPRSTQSSRSSEITSTGLQLSPSSPGCICALSEITAQLLDDNAVVRFQCLAHYRRTKSPTIRRCDADCQERHNHRPERFRSGISILQRGRSISAVDFSELLMRYFFCKTHGEGNTYKKFYCVELEQHWSNGDSTTKLELLDAIRKVHQLPSAQYVRGAPTADASALLSERPATVMTAPASVSAERLVSEPKPSISQVAIEEPSTSEGRNHFLIDEADSTSLPVPGAYRSDLIPSNPHLQNDGAHIESEDTINIAEEKAESSPFGFLKHSIRRLLFRRSPEPMVGTSSNAPTGPLGGKAVPDSEIDSLDAALARLSVSKNVSGTRSRELSPSQYTSSSESSPVEEQFFTPGHISTPSRVSRRNRSRIPVPQSIGQKDVMISSPEQLKRDYDEIRAILKAPKIREAYIYILSAPEYFANKRPGRIPLLKIGFAVITDVRIKTIRTKCHMYDLDRVHDQEYAKHRYHEMVEKIVHLELKRFQRDLPCNNCKPGRTVNHKEWHEVPVEVARQTVQRWQRFVAQDPFDNDGKLKDTWDMTLEDFMVQIQSEYSDDHEQRHDRWTKWLERGIEATAKKAAEAQE